MKRCPTGKVRHRSFKGAMVAVYKFKKRGITIAAYHCAPCNGWHLGNSQTTRMINVNNAIDRALKEDAAKRTDSKNDA